MASGSMTPTQIGAISNPTKSELINLHDEKIKLGVVPDDNIYADLPSTITKDRDWNLPVNQEHLIHSVRYPSQGENDQASRTIAGTNAYWKWQETNPVSGGMGQKIGTETVMTLAFKAKPQDTLGEWKAVEYRRLQNDGKSAIVILTCTNDKLVKQEKTVKQAELDLKNLLQLPLLDHQHTDVAEACHANVVRHRNKLTKLQAALKQAKEQARLTEEIKAGVRSLDDAAATALDHIWKEHVPGKPSKKPKI